VRHPGGNPQKHADFLRDFRGDTIHASTLDTPTAATTRSGAPASAGLCDADPERITYTFCG
jgi:hypothetical protein